MSSNHCAIKFTNVWKKYSRDSVFHRSIREDIANILNTRRVRSELSANEFWALKDVSFSIKPGETVGLFGHNGAGKSTILKLIANVTNPTIGTIETPGRIAPLIEIGAGFHPDLTGRENIYMNGTILGMNISEIRSKMQSIIDFSEIPEFIDMPVKKFSSGMYLRLGFSIAIHSEADTYLIDEILAVGDESFQGKCLDKIAELKKKKKTLLIVTHNRQLMEQIADKILFINKGELSETA